MTVITRQALAVFLLGYLSASAACASGASPASSTTFAYQGLERHYVLRAPPNSSTTDQLMPLVLVLHGGGGNAANAEAMTGFTEVGAREGFMVVYPEGSGRLDRKLLTWNAGHCCGYAMEHKIDDAGFISALIDRLIADYPVDARQVYVTGMSNGGMMTHRLGIELAGKVAAIAPVVATLFGDEKQPTQAVSAMMINGMLDKAVPYQGGPPGGRFPDAWDGSTAKPALAQADFWAGVGHCKHAVDRQESIGFTHYVHDCPQGTAVELYLLKDNGHAWPGGNKGSRRGDEPSRALNATEAIWDFFRSHPRQAVK